MGSQSSGAKAIVRFSGLAGHTGDRRTGTRAIPGARGPDQPRFLFPGQRDQGGPLRQFAEAGCGTVE